MNMPDAYREPPQFGVEPPCCICGEPSSRLWCTSRYCGPCYQKIVGPRLEVLEAPTPDLAPATSPNTGAYCRPRPDTSEVTTIRYQTTENAAEFVRCWSPEEVDLAIMQAPPGATITVMPLGRASYEVKNASADAKKESPEVTALRAAVDAVAQGDAAGACILLDTVLGRLEGLMTARDKPFAQALAHAAELQRSRRSPQPLRLTPCGPFDLPSLALRLDAAGLPYEWAGAVLVVDPLDPEILEWVGRNL